MNRRVLRELPSVDKVKKLLGPQGLPPAVVTHFIRHAIAEARRSSWSGGPEEWRSRIQALLDVHGAGRIRPVINGTGILIHTNLGRAPLARSAAELAATVGQQYSTLELDLASGSRGLRGAYLETHLALACGAEAATVVNNGAAALVLAIRPWIAGERREVLVSRGEAIQIGGGFRVPDILEAAGAVLRDVGTTNRTTLADFSRAVSRRTALILRVHRSNFFMEGFVESPALAALAAMAHKRRLPLVEDLGSGAMMNTEEHGLGEHEPRPSESLAYGADLVCFSGDKLFGGPQAGLIAGKKKIVAGIKKDPLFRAFRCDKLVLAALQETVDLHLWGGIREGQGEQEKLPLLRMLDVSFETLRSRGRRILERLGSASAQVELAECTGEVGGGSMPRALVPSLGLRIRPEGKSAGDVSKRLRLGRPAVVGYVAGQSVWIDLRTVLEAQDLPLADALHAALSGS